MSKIENIAEKNEYVLFSDEKISFYHPENWEVKINEYENGKKQYELYYLEHAYLDITTEDIDNFQNDYKMCIKRCFNDADPASLFSWKAMSCSENYTEENLKKFLSGDYINYLSTGPMPPGGNGSFIYSKVQDSIVISALYSSEDFFEYPKAKEVRSNKSWEEMSKEEKKIITDEQNYFDQEFYKIIKSFKISN